MDELLDSELLFEEFIVVDSLSPESSENETLNIENLISAVDETIESSIVQETSINSDDGFSHSSLTMGTCNADFSEYGVELKHNRVLETEWNSMTKPENNIASLVNIEKDLSYFDFPSINQILESPNKLMHSKDKIIEQTEAGYSSISKDNQFFEINETQNKLLHHFQKAESTESEKKQINKYQIEDTAEIETLDKCIDSILFLKSENDDNFLADAEEEVLENSDQEEFNLLPLSKQVLSTVIEQYLMPRAQDIDVDKFDPGNTQLCEAIEVVIAEEDTKENTLDNQLENTQNVISKTLHMVESEMSQGRQSEDEETVKSQKPKCNDKNIEGLETLPTTKSKNKKIENSVVIEHRLSEGEKIQVSESLQQRSKDESVIDSVESEITYSEIEMVQESENKMTTMSGDMIVKSFEEMDYIPSENKKVEKSDDKGAEKSKNKRVNISNKNNRLFEDGTENNSSENCALSEDLKKNEPEKSDKSKVKYIKDVKKSKSRPPDIEEVEKIEPSRATLSKGKKLGRSEKRKRQEHTGNENSCFEEDGKTIVKLHNKEKSGNEQSEGKEPEKRIIKSKNKKIEESKNKNMTSTDKKVQNFKESGCGQYEDGDKCKKRLRLKLKNFEMKNSQTRKKGKFEIESDKGKLSAVVEDAIKKTCFISRASNAKKSIKETINEITLYESNNFVQVKPCRVILERYDLSRSRKYLSLDFDKTLKSQSNMNKNLNSSHDIVNKNAIKSQSICRKVSEVKQSEPIINSKNKKLEVYDKNLTMKSKNKKVKVFDEKSSIEQLEIKKFKKSEENNTPLPKEKEVKVTEKKSSVEQLEAKKSKKNNTPMPKEKEVTVIEEKNSVEQLKAEKFEKNNTSMPKEKKVKVFEEKSSVEQLETKKSEKNNTSMPKEKEVKVIERKSSVEQLKTKKLKESKKINTSMSKEKKVKVFEENSVEQRKTKKLKESEKNNTPMLKERKVKVSEEKSSVEQLKIKKYEKNNTPIPKEEEVRIIEEKSSVEQLETKKSEKNNMPMPKEKEVKVIEEKSRVEQLKAKKIKEPKKNNMSMPKEKKLKVSEENSVEQHKTKKLKESEKNNIPILKERKVKVFEQTSSAEQLKTKKSEKNNTPIHKEKEVKVRVEQLKAKKLKESEKNNTPMPKERKRKVFNEKSCVEQLKTKKLKESEKNNTPILKEIKVKYDGNENRQSKEEKLEHSPKKNEKVKNFEESGSSLSKDTNLKGSHKKQRVISNDKLTDSGKKWSSAEKKFWGSETNKIRCTKKDSEGHETEQSESEKSEESDERKNGRKQFVGEKSEESEKRKIKKSKFGQSEDEKSKESKKTKIFKSRTRQCEGDKSEESEKKKITTSKDKKVPDHKKSQDVGEGKNKQCVTNKLRESEKLSSEISTAMPITKSQQRPFKDLKISSIVSIDKGRKLTTEAKDFSADMCFIEVSEEIGCKPIKDTKNKVFAYESANFFQVKRCRIVLKRCDFSSDFALDLKTTLKSQSSTSESSILNAGDAEDEVLTKDPQCIQKISSKKRYNTEFQRKKDMSVNPSEKDSSSSLSARPVDESGNKQESEVDVSKIYGMRLSENVQLMKTKVEQTKETTKQMTDSKGKFVELEKTVEHTQKFHESAEKSEATHFVKYKGKNFKGSETMQATESKDKKMENSKTIRIKQLKGKKVEKSKKKRKVMAQRKVFEVFQKRQAVPNNNVQDAEESNSSSFGDEKVKENNERQIGKSKKKKAGGSKESQSSSAKGEKIEESWKRQKVKLSYKKLKASEERQAQTSNRKKIKVYSKCDSEQSKEEKLKETETNNMSISKDKKLASEKRLTVNFRDGKEENSQGNESEQTSDKQKKSEEMIQTSVPEKGQIQQSEIGISKMRGIRKSENGQVVFKNEEQAEENTHLEKKQMIEPIDIQSILQDESNQQQVDDQNLETFGNLQTEKSPGKELENCKKNRIELFKGKKMDKPKGKSTARTKHKVVEFSEKGQISRNNGVEDSEENRSSVCGDEKVKESYKRCINDQKTEGSEENESSSAEDEKEEESQKRQKVKSSHKKLKLSDEAEDEKVEESSKKQKVKSNHEKLKSSVEIQVKTSHHKKLKVSKKTGSEQSGDKKLKTSKRNNRSNKTFNSGYKKAEIFEVIEISEDSVSGQNDEVIEIFEDSESGQNDEVIVISEDSGSEQSDEDIKISIKKQTSTSKEKKLEGPEKIISKKSTYEKEINDKTESRRSEGNKVDKFKKKLLAKTKDKALERSGKRCTVKLKDVDNSEDIIVESVTNKQVEQSVSEMFMNESNYSLYVKPCRVVLERLNYHINEKYLPSDLNTLSKLQLDIREGSDVNCEDIQESSSNVNESIDFSDGNTRLSSDFNDSDAEESSCTKRGKRSNSIHSSQSEQPECFSDKKVKNLSCNACDKTFKTYSSLNSHNNKCHKGILYKCVLCKLPFKSRTCYINHMKKIHPEKDPFVYQYPKCEKSFSTLKKVRDHEKSHFRYMCKFCKKRFAKKPWMREHVLKHH